MQDGAISSTSDSVISGVKAVSKGVIQREHQSTATVLCKNLFDPPNPFNRMSEDEIELYKSSVEHRTRSGRFRVFYVFLNVLSHRPNVLQSLSEGWVDKNQYKFSVKMADDSETVTVKSPLQSIASLHD